MVIGWEWLVIILALVVILLWGPSKIPELARGIGKAKSEFEKASRGYLHEKPKTKKEAAQSSDDDTVILIAKGLGIATEGKTRQEISQEILAGIKALKSGSSSS